jgi:hypothetical protein
VNLLITVPDGCYEKLLTPLQRSPHDPAEEFEYDDKSMQALVVLLGFLDSRLDMAEQVDTTATMNNNKEMYSED